MRTVNSQFLPLLTKKLSLLLSPKGHTAHSFAEYFYFIIHHKKWMLKVEGVDFFFLFSSI